MKPLLVRPRTTVSSIRACPWAWEVNSNSYWSDQAGQLPLPEPLLSLSLSGLRLLQIRYQIPHPVSTGDVQKYHFCSICCCR